MTEILVNFPSEKEEEAQKALKTYYTYIKAFAITADEPVLLGLHQDDLPAFQKLQGKQIHNLKNMKQALYRGLFTLKAMNSLPIEKYPEIAVTANFWAPVQAYYAVHGVGMATLIAVGMNAPGNHTSFLTAAANNIAGHLLPYPFSVTCKGYPFSQNDADVTFKDCSFKISDVRAISNLATPTTENSGRLIAKALLTTRERFLEERYKDARKRHVKNKKRRRHLKAGEKIKIAGNLHPTSVFDFFYRIRVRSNYDDPEMYIYGQGDSATAQDQYKNLVDVTYTLIILLESIIEKKIGAKIFRKLKEDFCVKE